MIILSPKHIFNVPVDAENITPDMFIGKNLDEIKLLRIYEGNRERILADIFVVEQKYDIQDDNASIQMLGDFTKVKRIGAKMSLGQIVVNGNVGMRLGEGMKGGKINVNGNADSWAGMMMKGGIIEISGNAGDYVGSSYRGSTVGMTGGKIIVNGDAGNEVGCFMNDGLINIKGKVMDFVGIHMRGGTILVEGDAGTRAGAEMMGGKIVILGKVPSILPSIIVDEFRKSVKVYKDRIEGPFYLFKGDITESWNGSVYILTQKNPHLKFYDAKIV